MKLRLILIGILTMLSILPISAATRIKSIRKVYDGLYVMYYDTSAGKRVITKSTIVEFKDYIALLEVPVSNDGAGATHLTDHTEGGEQVLAALKAYFPHKPLKYVLSSHWHPHSISSMLPFISSGITVVTTRKNFERLSEYVDSATASRYRQFIRFADDEGLHIGDKTNSIDIYKLNAAQYSNMPVEEFLFFYLPRYNVLHNSCMYSRFAANRAMGKEIFTERAEDLSAFLKNNKLSPRYLLGTDTYWDGPNDMIPADTLYMVAKTGIRSSALQQIILGFSETQLRMYSDSVIKYLLDNKIPTYLINPAVYKLMRENKLPQALALARLQALLNPADPNMWDTFGEVYYFMGEYALAGKYEAQCGRINKDWNLGGAEVWKKDLEAYSRNWKR